jgi:type IV pilus assembly protein PilC
MKHFTYVIRDKEGNERDGKIKANTIQQAKSFLKRKNLHVVSIKKEGTSLWKTLNEERTVKEDDIVAFSQLFAGCIRSGLTIKETLSLLAKQIENALLKDKLNEIILDIEGGTPLSVSFGKHNDVFPSFYAMLLKAGEASGDLATVLEYLGSYLEKIADLKKEIKGVVTYPLIVSCVGLGLLNVILVFVAPTFKSVFSESKKALPTPTVILFQLSDLVLHYKVVIIVFIISLISTIFVTYKMEKTKYYYHHFFLSAPLFGKLVKEVVLLRFLKAFDILVNNDVPILQALQVIEEGTGNLVLKKIIKQMRVDVSRGLPIAGKLVENKNVVPGMISYTVAMGEQSGNLGPTLTRISSFIDREITYTMKKFAGKIDPILTFGLGIMVLFIALAIYLPIFDMMSGV